MVNGLLYISQGLLSFLSLLVFSIPLWYSYLLSLYPLPSSATCFSLPLSLSHPFDSLWSLMQCQDCNHFLHYRYLQNLFIINKCFLSIKDTVLKAGIQGFTKESTGVKDLKSSECYRNERERNQISSKHWSCVPQRMRKHYQMGKHDVGVGLGRKIRDFVSAMLGVILLHSSEIVLYMEVQNFIHLWIPLPHNTYIIYI